MDSWCRGIAERRLLSFIYHGTPRIVLPVVHGGASLRGYQVGGHSTSGDLPDWRTFALSKVSDCEVLSERFIGVPPGYDPDDPQLRDIHCQL